MAEKKARLGRGLAELLGESPPPPAPETSPSEGRNEPGASATGAVTSAVEQHRQEPSTPQVGILELPIASLRPNPRQPRRDIDLESLQELAESMRALGIVQPIIARRVGADYEIIAGERRWRAARLAGFTVVPVIVREASDVESLEIALVENVVRRQLNPVDEAYALQVLLEDLGVTQEALAARLGRSRPALTNKMRLLDLPGPVQELLASGAISEGHGRALLALRGRGEQIKLAQKAAAKGISVRALEAEVKRLAAEAADGSPRAERVVVSDDAVSAAKARLYEVLGVTPLVRLGPKGGKLEIPFRDEAELRGLLARLEER